MDKTRYSRIAKAAKPEAPGRWFSFRAQADIPGEMDLFIYDEISWWGVTADEFVRELAGVQADTINLHLNTPGGMVFDGMAIYNALKAHKARVVTHIDGLAASMGSIIALAGDEVRIAQTAFVMIHNPWSIVLGAAADMRQEADLLDKIGGSMAEVYAGKTGKSVDEIKAIMEAETWWTGAEAVAAGYADSVFNADEKTSEAAARFDLSIFANVPKRLMDLAHGAPDRRRDGEPPTKRETEQALRDAGFSRTQAKAILVDGYKALSLRDAEDSGMEELAALMRRNTEILTR